LAWPIRVGAMLSAEIATQDTAWRGYSWSARVTLGSERWIQTIAQTPPE
jgi:hypothetical protein